MLIANSEKVGLYQYNHPSAKSADWGRKPLKIVGDVPRQGGLDDPAGGDRCPRSTQPRELAGRILRDAGRLVEQNAPFKTGDCLHTTPAIGRELLPDVVLPPLII